MRRLLWILAAAATVAAAMSATAQRRITPVGEPEMPKAAPRDSVPPVVHIHDSVGNIILIDTVANSVDTIAAPPRQGKMIYPLLNSVAVGVDIWDPVMRILGQHYGLGSVWGELNMHNRYFPYLEVGLGNADDTPDNGNFTYKVKTAPFFKIGASYNIFYNSDPAYQLKFGVRYGITRFTYEITDVTVDEGYWGDAAHFSLPPQSCTAGYFEVVAGVNVKIYRNFSMGWTLKFHKLIHETKSDMSTPMIIPGFGKRENSFTGGFSLIYTLPLNKPAPPEVTTTQGK